MSTWPQCTMLYDGSFAGFLSCIAESFRRREYPVYFIRSHAENASFYPLREVGTDPYLARLVYRSLRERVSPAFQKLVAYGFLADLPCRERRVFDIAYLGLWRERPPDPDDPEFMLLRRAVQKIQRSEK